MTRLERIFQKLEGDDPDAWPLPHDLVFAWLSFGLPFLLFMGILLAVYAGSREVPVEVEKQVLMLRPDGTYDYYIRLWYDTPEGRFAVSRLSTIFYSDLERATPFRAVYHPLWPDIGFLKGLRSFWLPLGMTVFFISLFAGGCIWLLHELLRNESKP